MPRSMPYRGGKGNGGADILTSVYSSRKSVQQGYKNIVVLRALVAQVFTSSGILQFGPGTRYPVHQQQLRAALRGRCLV